MNDAGRYGIIVVNMIVGIGIDTTEIERIKKGFENKRFPERIYSGEELLFLNSSGSDKRRFSRAAGNFAVKEAVSKALGTGIGKECILTDITCLRDEKGKPFVRLSGVTAETAQKLGISRFHVSITNTDDVATAFVVAEAVED